MNIECFGAADLQPQQLLVEAGRIHFGAELDRDILAPLGFVFGCGPRIGHRRPFAPFQVDDEDIAVLDAAALDRLVARGTRAKPLHAAVNHVLVDVRRRPAERERLVLAGVEHGQRVE